MYYKTAKDVKGILFLTNCRLTDPEFERGVKDFFAVRNVMEVFRHMRILQIAPRPFDFWSAMCNEGVGFKSFANPSRDNYI